MPTDPCFHMVVEDIFSIRSRGTVVTGTIDSGTLRPGDRIVVRGRNGERTTAVTEIQVSMKGGSQASAGDTVGLLLRDISREDVQCGDILLSPDSGSS
jgi:elongation factor Tu